MDPGSLIPQDSLTSDPALLARRGDCGLLLAALEETAAPGRCALLALFCAQSGSGGVLQSLKSPGPELLWGSWVKIPRGSQNSLPVRKVPKNAQNLAWRRKLALRLPTSACPPLETKLSPAYAFYLRATAG